MRKTEFANGEHYHIFNRGVEKRDVFLNDFDYMRFLQSLAEFNRTDPIGSIFEQSFRKKEDLLGNEVSKLVEIIAYCLNPNHYHLILKQLEDKGIEKFMHKMGVGYSKYFNHKYKRSGVLFQGVFKSKHIATNEYLLHLSSYVNCNSEIHGICKAENYKWCSFPDYINKRTGNLLGESLKKDIVIDQFRSVKEYKEFAKINAKEMKRRKDEEEFEL